MKIWTTSFENERGRMAQGDKKLALKELDKYTVVLQMIGASFSS